MSKLTQPLQDLMGTSSYLTWSGAPDTQGTWGLQQETWKLGSGQGDTAGEPMRTEVTETGGPSRLSKVVAVSGRLGVEHAWAGGCQGVAGERAGHILHRKQAMTSSIYNQQQVR
jgi:hypothetical protein